ncbi:De-etiolated protein 1 Det1-domain-containing protein [Polychytrium aggregatum]|uniref:De-etiolated protein 1 Det1-domain-containing protein n=1 Tax=Polychytrium aggregatum TaxID=110093 RepID=UPI0022FE418D|nr:De-etiolated protein 1 Det1-domain-containing protein [Polychytrium aggregatum]KAI9204104.1 De-etiolated protein 1 Det1-domain-containing protein [Polychytrium aggregatum]
MERTTRMDSPSPNISRLLRERELGGQRPGTHLHRERKAYLSIVPNHTLHNIVYPQGHFRKFTPDGQHLVFYTRCSVQVYKYLGPSVNSLTVDARNVFDTLFSLEYEVHLTNGPESICKEFCLFSADHKYMIVASTVSSNTIHDRQRRFPNSMRGMQALDNVTFWIICIKTGEITDRRIYKDDHIYLQNHSGVHLNGNLLGIVSVPHQSIYIVHITPSGKFIDVRTIGWLNSEDDELHLQKHWDAEEKFQRKQYESESAHSLDYLLDSGGSSPVTQPPPVQFSRGGRYHGDAFDPNLHQVPVSSASDPSRFNILSRIWSQTFAAMDPQISDGESSHMPLSGIKHRLMAYLFRRAVSSKSPRIMRHYYMSFQHFASLAMWRMQFLDDRHILIKFGSLEHVTGRSSDSASFHTSFFAIYSLETTHIIGVYESNSEELLSMYEKWNCLQSSSSALPLRTTPHSFITNPSNNEYARDALRKQIHSIRKARNGGMIQANRRVLQALPVTAQCTTPSPYFDHSIFSYDEKAITNTEKIRQCVDIPIKFYDRETGSLKYKFDLDIQSNPHGYAPPPRNSKRYVSYVFHPTDPLFFAIVQCAGQPPVVSVHLRA